VKNNISCLRVALNFLLALPLLALAGCSDIIPGLNVRMSDSGTHQFKVVENQDQPGYDVVRAAPVPEYRVVPITPEVLLRQSGTQEPASVQELRSLLPSDVPPEYRLGPGDVFFVVVWDHPELTSPYTGLTQDLASQGRLIAADGSSYYPYVGTFKASGMTVAQLRAYLAQHLSGVIQNPQVDVRVVAYRAGRIEVTGEVVKPSTLNFDDTPKGVLQAIDACGGLTLAASRRRAVLVRNGVLHEIDLAGLLSGSRPVSNPALEPGDVLHIPDQSGDQVFVLGAVQKQAPVIIQQDSMSLIQALTNAGGLDTLRGRDAGVLVFRPHWSDTDSKVVADIFALDLGRPEGVLLASQFRLQPRDVLYVKATAFAQYNAIIADLLPTVTTIFELHQLTK
jgi:polysaccharide export outer membrane protein